MSPIDVVRYWKDEEYRSSLSEEERSQMPQNPAGIIDMNESELEEEDLDLIVGAAPKSNYCQ